MPHLYEKNPVTYVAIEKLWDGSSIREAGVEFPWEGRPTPAMLPTCEEGVRRSAEAREWEKTGYLKEVPSNEQPQDDKAAAAREAAIKKAKALMKSKKQEAAGDLA